MNRLSNIVGVIVLISIIMINSLTAQEQKEQEAPKSLVAVLDFEAASGLSPQAALTLTNVFRNAVIRTKKFSVLERSDMQSILEEQAFSLSGVCNSAECAIEVGKLLSAEKIILGSVGKIGDQYYSTVRIVNVTKGNIEESADEKFDADAESIFEVYDTMAKKLAGTYEESNTWWYIGGAAVVGAGAAAYLLLSAEDTPVEQPTVGTPPANPEVP